MSFWEIAIALVGFGAVVLPFIFDRKLGVGLWGGGWDLRNYLSRAGVVIVAAGGILHAVGCMMVWLP